MIAQMWALLSKVKSTSHPNILYNRLYSTVWAIVIFHCVQVRLWLEFNLKTTGFQLLTVPCSGFLFLFENNSFAKTKHRLNCRLQLKPMLLDRADVLQLLFLSCLLLNRQTYLRVFVISDARCQGRDPWPRICPGQDYMYRVALTLNWRGRWPLVPDPSVRFFWWTSGSTGNAP